MDTSTSIAIRKTLTPEQRARALGVGAFAEAYEFIFNRVEAIYTTTGGINHQLIGVDFEEGKPMTLSILPVRRPEDVQRNRPSMIERWPLVAHVVEAWAAPDETVMPPSAHPQRFDVVSIMLFTPDCAAAAMCRVDEADRTIEQAELIFPDQIGGRFGHALPQRH